MSVNKLARVASIATPQNESEWAEAVKILPKSAVETLVRDGLNKPLIEVKSVPGHRFQFGEKLTERLLELESKGFKLDEILNELLDKREEEIAEEKAAIAANLPEMQSRYVPVRTMKVIHKEHGTKCAIPTCKKPSEQVHHTQTYALSQRHDPHYLAPLCKEHHLLAHSIDLKVHERRKKALQ